MNCKYLDHQLCIRTDGQYRFCCISLESTNKENVKTHTPEEWLTSPTIQNAKRKFSQGEWPEGCSVCERKEKLGLKSKRISAVEYGPGVSHLDIRFGNSCNLKCITCWEMSSSSIAEEAIEMKKQNIIPINNILINPNFNWANTKIIERLTKYPLKEVYLTGGEPMMVKHLPSLLEYLDKDVIIRFNTNGTIYNDKLEKLLKKFKNVHISLSLDAIGKKIEYIRFGSTWNNINENIKKYKNFCQVINISPTISVLNAPYMDELMNWADSNYLSVYLNYLDNPKYLHVKNAPDNLKKLFQHTNGWEIGVPDQTQVELFKKNIIKLDSFRKIKIKDYLPEVAEAYEIS